MALTATQDMEEDSLYLETASNEMISKLVQKISQNKKGKDKIKSTYNDYLEFTAVHKPDSISHDPKKLHSAVQKVIPVAVALMSELENRVMNENCIPFCQGRQEDQEKAFLSLRRSLLKLPDKV